jgi:transcription elongation factor Elf1
MPERSTGHPAVRFCPFCGQPLGSFFGARIEGGAACCDRCGECFRVLDVEVEEDIDDAPG